jgi:hypothetical protein
VTVIEEKIDQLIAALNAATAAFSHASPKVSAAPKATAAAKPAAPAPVQVASATGITEDSLRDQLRALLGSKDKDAVVAALNSVGASKLSDVKEGDYGKLSETIKKANSAVPAADPFA